MEKDFFDIKKEKWSCQLYPLGDSAIVIQFGDEIMPDIQEKLRALSSFLEENPFPGMIEVVPAFTTLTIYYNPWILSEKGKINPWNRVKRLLQGVVQEVKKDKEVPEKLVEVPVCYGGEYGPDLEFVAHHHQLSPEEVVSIHANALYLVYMIGFAPGFPYLGGMDPRIAIPRKENPRPRIPAGSVGIAGLQTGIYSLATPGGWQLIGRTPLRLFYPQRECPSLLKAGDRLKFVPISEEEYKAREVCEHEP